MDLAKLTADVFEKLLFERFHVKRPEFASSSDQTANVGSPSVKCEESEIELIEVDRHYRMRKLEGGLGERKREPFTLLFRGSHSAAFVSHIHTLVHDKLGDIEVFMNPVNVDPIHQLETHPQGRFYEVHFN